MSIAKDIVMKFSRVIRREFGRVFVRELCGVFVRGFGRVFGVWYPLVHYSHLLNWMWFSPAGEVVPQ